MSRIASQISRLKEISEQGQASPAEVDAILRDILNIIGQQMPLGVFTLHAGSELIRVRPNEEPSASFTLRENLSYKPQQFNKTFQRASTPDQTMFYGSLVDYGNATLPNRITSTLEGIPWLREPASTGKQKVTYSRWSVTGDINLFAVIFNPKFADNRQVKEHILFTTNFIKEKVPDFAPEILEFYEFISSEFGKVHRDDNHLSYVITAIFTEIFIEKGKGRFDGILYPSCRVYGDASNIAILPNVADNKLNLIAAGECMIYKNGMHTIVDNLTISSIHDGSPLTDIEYVPVANENTRGEEKIYEELGVESLEFK